MKKLILISSLFLLCFSFYLQKSFAQYDDNGYHVSDPRHHVEFNLKKFNYKNVWYPIVDPVTLKYYGEDKYAKSFDSFVPVDTVIKTKFSNFLLERKKVFYSSRLHNGYVQKDKKEVGVLETKKVYIEFFLFFILLPILIYIIGSDIEIGNYDPYFVKMNFSFLAFSFLFAISFDFVLFNLIPLFLKLDYDKIIYFFGSYILYTFTSFLVIMFILRSFLSSFRHFISRDFPIIVFTAIMAGIFAGIDFTEINQETVLRILCYSLIGYVAVAFFVEVVFMYFYDNYKEKQERLERERKKNQTIDIVQED